MPFELGQTYTRQAISNELGGNQQHFLPTVFNRVVAACVREDKNPRVPAELWVGDGDTVTRSAQLWLSQGDAIPLFVRRAAHAWEYMGRFVIDHDSVDAATLALLAEEAGRVLTRVLYLRQVANP